MRFRQQAVRRQKFGKATFSLLITIVDASWIHTFWQPMQIYQNQIVVFSTAKSVDSGLSMYEHSDRDGERP